MVKRPVPHCSSAFENPLPIATLTTLLFINFLQNHLADFNTADFTVTSFSRALAISTLDLRSEILLLPFVKT